MDRELTLVFDLGLRYDRDSIGKNNNLAPRLGFVVTPTDSGRTVVRGGVGIFYDKIPLNVGSFEQYQRLEESTFFVDQCQNRLHLSCKTRRPSIWRILILAWNVQLDHQLNQRLLLRFGYEIASHAVISCSSQSFTKLLLENGGRSRYRELQATARFRFQEGRNIFLSYVRSRHAGI